MDAPELVVIGGHRPCHRRGRVRPGSSAFNQDAGTAGVDGLVGDPDHAADRRQVGLIHWLVGLGLTQDSDFAVVFQDRIPGVDDPGDRWLRALGLTDVAPRVYSQRT